MNKIFKIIKFFETVPVQVTATAVMRPTLVSLIITTLTCALVSLNITSFLILAALFIRFALIGSGSNLSARAFALLAILSLFAVFSINNYLLNEHDLFSYLLWGPTLALVALARSAKLKTGSDAAIVSLLLVFLASVLSIAGDSLAFSFLCTGLVILNVTSLLKLNTIHFSWSTLLSSARILLLALVYTIPLLVFLLFMYERAEKSLNAASGASLVGFTEHLEPGQITKLLLRNESAYRVRLTPEPSFDHDMYWRSATLTRSLGLEWDTADFTEGFAYDDDMESPCLIYQDIMRVDEALVSYPFALDRPLNMTVRESKGRVASWICPHARELELDESERLKFMRLDIVPSARVQALASSWLHKDSAPAAIIMTALQFFGSGFRYSSHPSSLAKGAQGLESFLFDRREGFCEHYAAALATLLRLAKVPARVVVGYQGGERNAFGGYWRIAYSDAHSWVEAWDGASWRRLDATKLLPSEKIQNSDTSSRLALFVDALSYFGSRGSAHAMHLFYELSYLVKYMFFALIFIIFGLSFRYFSYFRSLVFRSEPAKLEAHIHKLCSRLARFGLHRKTAEGYETFRVRVSGALNGGLGSLSLADKQTIDEGFVAYIQLKYFKHPPSTQDLRQVNGRLRAFFFRWPWLRYFWRVTASRSKKMS